MQFQQFIRNTFLPFWRPVMNYLLQGDGGYSPGSSNLIVTMATENICSFRIRHEMCQRITLKLLVMLKIL